MTQEIHDMTKMFDTPQQIGQLTLDQSVKSATQWITIQVHDGTTTAIDYHGDVLWVMQYDILIHREEYLNGVNTTHMVKSWYVWENKTN